MSRTIVAALVLSVVGFWLNSACGEQPAALSDIVADEFVDTPLEEALQTLAMTHKIPIRLDSAALADVGIANDEPISFPTQEITLESLLELMLTPLGLTTYIYPDGTLEVTTTEIEDERFDTRVYDLRPVTGLDAVDDDKILHAVMNGIEGQWEVIDGIGGRATIDGDTLVIEQTSRTRRRVADLLAQMTRIVNPNAAPPLTTAEKKEAAIRQRMAQPITLEWKDMDFDDVMKEIGKRIDAPVLVYVVRQGKHGDSLERPLTIVVKNQPLAEVLDTVLEPRELAWFIEDEVVTIMTKAEAADELVTRVYDVRGKVPTAEDAQKLIDKLQSAGFATWEGIDGIGGTLNILNGMLIVQQHREALEKVAEMLKSL